MRTATVLSNAFSGHLGSCSSSKSMTTECLLKLSCESQLATHTDRLLGQTSYNPTSHKAINVQTLTRREQIVCNSQYQVIETFSRQQQPFSGLQSPRWSFSILVFYSSVQTIFYFKHYRCYLHALCLRDHVKYTTFPLIGMKVMR